MSAPEKETTRLSESASAQPTESTEQTVQYVEAAEKRRQRISTGVLIAVVAVVLLILIPTTSGTARFALSDAFDEVQLPTLTVPGVVTLAVCAVLALAAAVGFLSGRCDEGQRAGARGRFAVVIGSCTGPPTVATCRSPSETIRGKLALARAASAPSACAV